MGTAQAVPAATPIEQRGYAHPEVLVSTDWVAQHLNDPKVRLVESNEDILLYDTGHIPGAVSIPVQDLPERITELPDDAEIVVYCRGEYCVLAYDAVRLLTDRGRRAIRLQDGMLEWRLAQMPVHAGEPR